MRKQLNKIITTLSIFSLIIFPIKPSNAAEIFSWQSRPSLTIFLSIDCRFAAEAVATVKKLSDKNAGKFNILYKYLPNPNSTNIIEEKALVLSESYGKFIPFYRALSKHPVPRSERTILNTARKIGLPKEFGLELENPLASVALEQAGVLTTSLAIKYSPTILLNGIKLEGTKNVTELEAILRLTGKINENY
jgi:hypothetical protein